YYGECGGCQIQHIIYKEQLRLKVEMLKQSILRYTSYDLKDIKFHDMIGMEKPMNYRNKSQMPVRNTEEGMISGLYKKGSNELVSIDNCPIQNEAINRVNKAVVKIMDKYEIFAFDPSTMRGMLRYIVTRVSEYSGEIQVTLVVTIYNRALQPAAKEILELSDVVSVAISKNRDAKNVEIFGEEVEVLEGKNTITEGIGNIRYDITPKAFYQLNPKQAEKLYQEVEKHLDFKTDKVIIDAYSGSGAVSMFLANKVEKVLGIDMSKESIYSALHNAKVNKFTNTQFEIGQVNEVLSKYMDKKFNPDVIIFDPPRSGIDYNTIDMLLSKTVKKIIYISCNPSTLAKNINSLSKKYVVDSITPLDMFPHTSHIESITVLRLR
ncbi:MAG: 23S rRNA (uracil(1939)-C(5))-methyltransferase RlmD, partial [Candidatus Izemoplasma sp.]